ncbi:hypothetical protein Scep_022219 [Stephania cephalantha]|uniref:Uncharacterized protein n=1 Tax=Stephania cephalantha TaxID=152367 RepID=A0AAP0I231_9MAGN
MNPSNLAPPPTTTNIASAREWRWKSPVPYLFIGLAVMLGLITLALLVLACLPRSSSSSSDEVEKKRRQVVLPRGEMEPKIVVIMPGEDMPTYLARPL